MDGHPLRLDQALPLVAAFFRLEPALSLTLVASGDVHRLTGLWISAAAGGAADLLDGQEAGKYGLWHQRRSD